jgi:hypothetical protein
LNIQAFILLDAGIASGAIFQGLTAATGSIDRFCDVSAILYLIEGWEEKLE